MLTLLTNERGELVFVNQNSITVSGFASQVWIARRRLQAVTRECAWGLWLTQGTPICPSSRHLHPFQQNLILISFFQKLVEFLLCAHHEGLFRKKIKISCFASKYSIWDVLSRKKTQTLPNQRFLYLKHHVFVPARRKTAPPFQWHVIFKVLLIFRYIFLVCVLIKLPNQPSGLHQCRGFREDYSLSLWI